MFAISPESSVCVVLDDTNIYILLHILKHCNGNLHFREGTLSSKEVIMCHQIEKPLAIQLSDEIQNILLVFHVLTGCHCTNPSPNRSKIQRPKKMFLKPELTTLIQFLKTPEAATQRCSWEKLF